MAFTKYFHRIERMHAFIKRKATGTPDEFADKMNLSRSALMRDIQEMKAFGAPICYDSIRESYYYCDEVEFSFGFKKLSATEMTKHQGGSSSQEISSVPQYETAMMQVCPT